MIILGSCASEGFILLSYAQLCNISTDLSSIPARFPMIVKQRYLCSEEIKDPRQLCSDRDEKMYGRNSLIF